MAPHVPPLEIILLYCAPPGPLLSWYDGRGQRILCVRAVRRRRIVSGKIVRGKHSLAIFYTSVVPEGTAHFSLLVRMPPKGI